jgi:hypothetical protein
MVSLAFQIHRHDIGIAALRHNTNKRDQAGRQETKDNKAKMT